MITAYPTLASNKLVISKYFDCNQKCSEDSTKCIPVFWYCDGKSDCPYGSDEIDCSCKDLGMIDCVTQGNNTACIPFTWVCQAHPECSGFDKIICEVYPFGYICEENQYWCHLDRKCINVLQVCDNKTDYTGGEDEAYCSGKSTLEIN